MKKRKEKNEGTRKERRGGGGCGVGTSEWGVGRWTERKEEERAGGDDVVMVLPHPRAEDWRKEDDGVEEDEAEKANKDDALLGEMVRPAHEAGEGAREGGRVSPSSLSPLWWWWLSLSLSWSQVRWWWLLKASPRSGGYPPLLVVVAIPPALLGSPFACSWPSPFRVSSSSGSS
jgi:hypothetical protein